MIGDLHTAVYKIKGIPCSIITGGLCTDIVAPISTDSASLASNIRMESILKKANKKDLQIIRSLVHDVALNKVCDHIGEDVLWNSNAFISKLGYKKLSYAYKHESARSLVRYEMTTTEAVDMTEIDGIKIMNPVQASDVTWTTPGPVQKIRFMLTRDLLQWIGDARTPESGDIRMALWWFFASADKEHMERLLQEKDVQMEREVCSPRAPISYISINYANEVSRD